jgi:uncharacterized protein (TIGR04255 family)
MPISFERAPLVELLAEFRWGPQQDLNQLTNPQGVQMLPLANSSKAEEYFTRLGGELSKAGFQRSERLIPPGFPALPNQAIIRYRSNDGAASSILFHAGTGLFSIHAIPPYHSWQQILPFVEIGINALLKSRIEVERDQPIALVSLRYIDLFTKELTQELSVVKFVTEILGFSVGLPKSLIAASEAKEATNLNLTFVLPIAPGVMNVTVADGTAGNRSGIVMNVSVASKKPIDARIDAILEFLNIAHEVIHNAFISMTGPINTAMMPREEGTQ